MGPDCRSDFWAETEKENMVKRTVVKMLRVYFMVRLFVWGEAKEQWPKVELECAQRKAAHETTFGILGHCSIFGKSLTWIPNTSL